VASAIIASRSAPRKIVHVDSLPGQVSRCEPVAVLHGTQRGLAKRHGLRRSNLSANGPIQQGLAPVDCAGMP
jgi:hypothetical protein